MNIPTINFPTVEIPANVEETFERLTSALRDFDVRDIDLSNVELPKFDLPDFDLPDFDLPDFEMPEFRVPEFDLPQFDMPDVDVPSADRLVEIARDAAYVGVGVAVVTAQRADERRREMTDAVTDGMRRLVDTVA